MTRFCTLKGRRWIPPSPQPSLTSRHRYQSVVVSAITSVVSVIMSVVSVIMSVVSVFMRVVPVVGVIMSTINELHELLVVLALVWKSPHSFYHTLLCAQERQRVRGQAKKITPKLIVLFEAARGGVKKDHRIKDHASLLAVCDVLHEVRYPSDGQPALPCEGNPAGLECVACKSFKQVGICSHVLTINHMMKLFNVRFQLKSVQTNALKKAGQRGSRKLLPALQREPQVAPDSSDEEEERLQLLGQQGK